MFKSTNLRFPAFFALTMLLLGVQASAQVEVSPDHFDKAAPAQQAAHRRPTNGKANATSTPNHTSQTTTVAAKRKSTAQKKGAVSKKQSSKQQTVAAANPR